jgi:hypothetical protein
LCFSINLQGLTLVIMITIFHGCYRYLRDGLATTKSDVYAFGVVLFELISGKEAITRAEGMGASSNSERRSLASVVSLTIHKLYWTFYNNVYAFTNDLAIQVPAFSLILITLYFAHFTLLKL